MLNGKTIVIGVSGGIAVYKVCDLVSKLKKLNANIHVVMTESATEFVAPLTFQSLSGQPVVVNMFEKIAKWDIEHIELAKAADLFIMAPATANLIGKMAHGIADDMLTTTVMATKAPVLIAPAMNTNMYQNPIVQDNISKLKDYGYHFIAPASGRLACGDIGEGKLADVDDILKVAEDILFSNNVLKNTSILITAGPTIESVDPVRFFTNHSSGKMGYALAKAAINYGADVTLISGPVKIDKPNGLSKFIQVKSANGMFDAVKDNIIDKDIIIKTAAVADYCPIEYSNSKIKKQDDDLIIKMKRNPDILKWIGMHKKSQQTIVGFAAETNDVMDNGIKKLRSKNLDMIVINDVTAKNAGFNTDTNEVRIVTSHGDLTDIPVMPKTQLAYHILDKIMDYRNLSHAK